MIGGHCFGFNAQQTSSLPTKKRQRDCSHRTQRGQKGRDGYMRLTGREGDSKAVKKEGRKKTRGEKERERGSRKTRNIQSNQ